MSSIGSVIAALDGLVRSLAGAREAAEGASGVVADAHGAAAAIGLSAAVEQLAGLATPVERIGADLSAMEAQAAEAQTQARALRGDGPNGVGQRPVPGPSGVPSWLRDAAARLPPREGDRGPTHGLAFDAAGRPLGSGMIRSREDPSLAADLVPQARTWLAAISHVEARVAAMMRRGQEPAEVSVVVNNEVCVGPRSCDALLPGMLRPGQRMRVYVTDPGRPGGVRFVKDYDGNGKGIRP